MMQIDPELFYNFQKLAKGGVGVGWEQYSIILTTIAFSGAFLSRRRQKKCREASNLLHIAPSPQPGQLVLSGVLDAGRQASG